MGDNENGVGGGAEIQPTSVAPPGSNQVFDAKAVFREVFEANIEPITRSHLGDDAFQQSWDMHEQSFAEYVGRGLEVVGKATESEFRDYAAGVVAQANVLAHRHAYYKLSGYASSLLRKMAFEVRRRIGGREKADLIIDLTTGQIAVLAKTGDTQPDPSSNTPTA